MNRTSAVLLAAGFSSRMGRLKALLPLRTSSLVEYQVESLDRSGVDHVFVVVGHRGEDVAVRISNRPRVTVIDNPDFAEGKTTSIKAGLQYIDSSYDAILVLAVDQPRPMSVLSALIDSHYSSSAPITFPVFEGHSGHPIIFSSSLLPELKAITEENEGLRQISRSYRNVTNIVDWQNAVVTLDVNTPENLLEAEKLLPEEFISGR